MELKRARDVEPSELERIEHPFYAAIWVRQNFLKLKLRDIRPGPHNLKRLNRDALVKAVKAGEVVLVRRIADQNFVPLLQRAEGKDGTKVEHWRKEELYDPLLDFNVTCLIRGTIEKRLPMIPPVLRETRAQPQRRQRSVQEFGLSNPRWELADAPGETAEWVMPGDEVLLKVDVSGATEGTPVRIKVFDTAISPPLRVASIAGEVTQGVGVAEWTVKFPRRREENRELPLEFEARVQSLRSERAQVAVVSQYIFSF